MYYAYNQNALRNVVSTLRNDARLLLMLQGL